MQLQLIYEEVKHQFYYIYNFGRAFKGKISRYRCYPTLYDDIIKGVEEHGGGIAYFRRVPNTNPYFPEDEFNYITIT